MERIELTFDPDYHALLNTSSYFQRRRYSGALRWRALVASLVVLVGGGFLAGMGGIYLSERIAGLPELAAIAVLFVLVLLFYQFIVRPWLLRSSARQIAQDRPVKPLHFTASDEGLSWSDADSDFRLRWTAIERIFATPENIAFMTGALAFVVPKASFADSGQLRDFLQAVLARIAPAAAAASSADPSLKDLI